MPPDAQAIVAALPDWLKVGANAALFVVGLAIAVLAIRKGHKEGEPGDKPELDDLLDSSPVKTFLDNMRLQTEAMKVMAAALGAMAKVHEADFDERRVHREVERRLAEERRRSSRD